eukprot:5138019-Alexandrium_andersonii.AAC.1
MEAFVPPAKIKTLAMAMHAENKAPSHSHAERHSPRPQRCNAKYLETRDGYQSATIHIASA